MGGGPETRLPCSWSGLSVQWWRSRSAQTLLPDYWQVWQRTDLASCFVRGSVASASTCSTSHLKCTALRRSIVWWCVPCFYSWATLPRIHSSRAHPRHVSMPSCNDTDYIRKMIIWKYFSLYIVQVIVQLAALSASFLGWRSAMM